MQGKNGDADIENGLADPVREGESVTNGESSGNIYIYIYIYTLACVKWMVAERLLITQAASQSGAL